MFKAALPFLHLSMKVLPSERGEIMAGRPPSVGMCNLLPLLSASQLWWGLMMVVFKITAVCFGKQIVVREQKNVSPHFFSTPRSTFKCRDGVDV